MSYSAPAFDVIYQNLLSGYQAQLDRAHYDAATGVDPFLDTIFRLFASQMEKLYVDQEQVRLGLLDEMIQGLSVRPRRAAAAQTVVRCLPSGVRVVKIPDGFEFLSDAADGGRVAFAADQALRVSGARIGMALAFQNRQIRPCCQSQWAANPLAPKEASQADWGDGTSLLLALEDLPNDSLAGLSIFFDTAGSHEAIRKMLEQSIWRLADDSGRFGASGVFRPRRVRGGVMELRPAFQSETSADQEPDSEEEMAGNYYSGSVFLFPDTEELPSPSCSAPLRLQASIDRLFPPINLELVRKKRVWLRISLLSGTGAGPTPQIATVFSQISLHAMSFSNLECRNWSSDPATQGATQSIEFAESGRFLAGLRAVHGGHRPIPVVPLLDPAARGECIRYSIRPGRIEIAPQLEDDATPFNVNIRIWMTTGTRANAAGAPPVEVPLSEGGKLLLSPLKPARGGRNEEERSNAEARFAFAIRSRGHIVTEADLLAAVHACDSRITNVTSKTVAVRVGSSLQTKQRIEVELRLAEFPESSYVEELQFLKDDLQRSLRGRLPFDTDIEITTLWDNSVPEGSA